MYTEDVDFCAAIRARGRRILFTPDGRNRPPARAFGGGGAGGHPRRLPRAAIWRSTESIIQAACPLVWLYRVVRALKRLRR